jgi:hypothetical protein
MSKYNDKFTLNPDDLELIENALESQVSQQLQSAVTGSDSEGSDAVRQIRQLLGKLHNQKVFYSHANPGVCPLG